ncbi:MAG TPA: hypothetical protein VG204_02565 [Terriglobia bacterium]|nr:hypothetical protein [Terriglobia bacterium]
MSRQSAAFRHTIPAEVLWLGVYDVGEGLESAERVEERFLYGAIPMAV